MNRATGPAEPMLEALTHPAGRYFLATRFRFLTITLAGCLLGFASARAGGFAPPLAATLWVSAA